MRTTDESCGGDPPCWSHLFEEEAVGPTEAGPVDLVAVARSVAGRGPAWTLRSEDLDANLLVFPTGEGVAEHVNEEVDVLLVGIAGEGVVTIDGRAHLLKAGRVILVRKGTCRGTRAQAECFSYPTCHRRRAGLQPTRSPR